METGGFKEWHMELIETIHTKDDVERRQREQYWIDEMKPDLNDRGAFRIKL